MHLPDRLRDQLKKPLGILIKESQATKENVLKNISPNSFVICVGDATTEKMIRFGVTPSLQIVDGLEKRAKREIPSSVVKTALSCKNPAAEISDESIDIIKKAFKSTPPVRITVSGEEDLLVLPVCVLAPENSVVLYGQPNEGLVVVNVTQEIRNKVQSIMDSMS